VFVTCPIPTLAMKHLEDGIRTLGGTIQSWPHVHPSIPRAELLKAVENVDGLFCILEDSVNQELLNAAKQLKVVSTMSVGFDHIDVQDCCKRGIVVGNTPGVLTETTADLTLALMLATCRLIPEALSAARDGSWGRWKPEWLCGRDLHHSTVGIVGMGGIGQAVARRLSGFGCKILYTGPTEKPALTELKAQFVELETLLKESDIVTAHCPLNRNTKQMFNASLFKQMKRTAIFINTTRGGVVDQDDLYDALKNGVIHSAGIDVTSPEPLPTNHKLFELKNLIILPHIGSATIETRTNMAMIAAENLLRGLQGQQLLHVVQPK